MQLLFHFCNVKMFFVDVDHFIGNCLYCSILIEVIVLSCVTYVNLTKYLNIALIKGKNK